MDAVSATPVPVNEPVRQYQPGSHERAALESKIKELAGQRAELTMTIGGAQRAGAGEPIDVVQPHNRRHVLGTLRNATDVDVAAAIHAAKQAAPAWQALSFDDRAAVFLKAADLLAGPWRATLNAATILGQSKSPYQAEIDAACELIDFWRYNVHFARRLLAEQPESAPGTWNRMEYRPLEGFVLAITPFNFTSIAGNLPTAPALLGNVVVWKPSPTQQLAAHYTMRLLEAAGLPPGVINMVTGDGQAVSRVALPHPDLAGIHFTGSTTTFRHLWRTVGANIDRYRNYPRLVGETGGKDFVVVHPSAEQAAIAPALIRGAFEYQGQKCSAASRAYLPASLWQRVGDDFLAQVESLTMGDVASDLSLFMGAVIDERAFAKHKAAIDRARSDALVRILAGGQADDSEGFFVRPTVLSCPDPADEAFTTEYFGPILAVHVYPDAEWPAMLAQAADVAPYALTGSVLATDRAAIAQATDVLRYAAGNFYINDKPTGAVVGQQPFGGARASGTDDKAGSVFNLIRWVSARAVKELFVPPADYRYPHMGQ
jgi:1-pyrroline-5-carboxylate dehydrogenase